MACLLALFAGGATCIPQSAGSGALLASNASSDSQSSNTTAATLLNTTTTLPFSNATMNPPAAVALSAATAASAAVAGAAAGAAVAGAAGLGVVSPAAVVLAPQDAVIESRGYGDRISDSIGGFVFGLLLLVFAPTLICTAEIKTKGFRRTLRRAKKLAIGPVSTERVSSKYEGRVVYMTGPASTTSMLADAGAGGPSMPPLSQRPALRLQRRVEMFQWVERQETSKNSKSYRYSLEWREHDVDSSQFRHSYGHHNPPRHVKLESEILNAPDARLGAFELSDDVLSNVSWWCDCSPTEEHAQAIGRHLNVAARATGGAHVYIPADGALGKEHAGVGPSLGDVRVAYRQCDVDTMSVVGVQARPSLREYTRKDEKRLLSSGGGVYGGAMHGGSGGDHDDDDGDEQSGGFNPWCCCCWLAGACLTAFVGTGVLLVGRGVVSKAELFRRESRRSDLVLAVCRVLGSVLFVLAFVLILNPIAQLVSFLPVLDDLLSSIFFVAALIVGLACAAVTLAGAWVYVRPFAASGLLAGVGTAALWAAGVFDPAKAVTPAGWVFSLAPFVFAAGSLGVGCYQLVEECRFDAAVRRELDAIEQRKSSVDQDDPTAAPVAVGTPVVGTYVGVDVKP